MRYQRSPSNPIPAYVCVCVCVNAPLEFRTFDLATFVADVVTVQALPGSLMRLHDIVQLHLVYALCRPLSAGLIGFVI